MNRPSSFWNAVGTVALCVAGVSLPVHAKPTPLPPKPAGKPTHKLPKPKPSAKTPKPAADHVALDILLVEDNPLNAMLALKVLENAGHSAGRLSNGQEVVDRIRAVLDGLCATRQIRELEAETDGAIPIVALTANAMPEDREACLEAGMNAYLAKPFDADDLAAVLQDVTGNN